MEPALASSMLRVAEGLVLKLLDINALSSDSNVDHPLTLGLVCKPLVLGCRGEICLSRALEGVKNFSSKMFPKLARYYTVTQYRQW